MTSEKTEDSFAAMFEQQGPRLAKKRRAVHLGDRVEGVVVHVGRDAVFVELEGMHQAFIDATELRASDGTISVKEGDRVGGQVVEIDDKQGIRLGRSIGKPGSIAALEQAKEGMLGVDGKVIGVNKGGLEIEVGGTRAFCPMSQADDKFVEDAKALIGQTLQFLVTDVRDGGKNVVVSRRAFLKRQASESAARAMNEIVPGAVLRGTVASVRDFGAFVELGGGVLGLIPRSEIGHDRRQAVAEALKAGDLVEVQVKEVKNAPPSNNGQPAPKITLSMKALMSDPWAEADIVEGRVVSGIVTKVTEFGKFVRLAPGIEGLVHVSELPRGVSAEEGESMLVVIKKMDRQAKKISLVPAPDGAAIGSTLVATDVAKVGALVRGAVERIETYGVFVQLEGTKGRAGRGLIPLAELGVPRGTDLRKTFPDGTLVTAKVLETGEGRLRLSLKGAKEAEERSNFEQVREKQGAHVSLGTFADLVKGKKR